MEILCLVKFIFNIWATVEPVFHEVFTNKFYTFCIKMLETKKLWLTGSHIIRCSSFNELFSVLLANMLLSLFFSLEFWCMFLCLSSILRRIF